MQLLILVLAVNFAELDSVKKCFPLTRFGTIVSGVESAEIERLECNREWPTPTVRLNSTNLIGWDPGFAFADWLGSKT